MFRRPLYALLTVILGAAFAQAQKSSLPCPGYNAQKNVTLACEFFTLTRTTITSNGSTAGVGGKIGPTLATALSQLPVATAVSGTGLSFSRTLGVSVATNDSLGSILTQRGESLGRHNWYFSVDYQRFSFDTIDGISLKDLKTVNEVDFNGATCASGARCTFNAVDSRVDLRVDQFTGIASFGLTSRIDVAAVIPYSVVTMSTGLVNSGEILSALANGQSTTNSGYGVLYTSNGAGAPAGSSLSFITNPKTGAPIFSFPGQANGIGDVTFNVKANVFNGERTKMAIGSDFRLNTGDETNYLGTGAYGFKPYFVISHRGRRLTPHANIGYQWNGVSQLATDSNGEHNLPASFEYDGGIDIRASKRFTVVGEFLGQAVINAPRVVLSTVQVPGANLGGSAPETLQTLAPRTGTYAMDNAGIGFKANPVAGLIITANALFQLDNTGLRARVVPLFGVSYRFGK